MTREEFYKTDRKERDYYKNTTDKELILPLTEDGFESLLEIAASMHDLLVDDRLRSWCSAYIHHIPNDKMHFSMKDLSISLFRSHCNNMTFDIDQAAKKREALKKKEADEKQAQVIPINN